MSTITSSLSKTIHFSQPVKVDGKNAVIMSASINSDDPSAYTISCNTVSQSLYKENRDAIVALRSEFEDTVWAAQEALAAEAEDDTTEESEDSTDDDE